MSDTLEDNRKGRKETEKRRKKREKKTRQNTYLGVNCAVRGRI
jgi:hypothetical protein